MVSANWFAAPSVDPANDGSAENEPSPAVATTTVRLAAAPPGGMGAPFRKASTVTVTEVPPGSPVVPVTVVVPVTKSNDAENEPPTEDSRFPDPSTSKARPEPEAPSTPWATTRAPVPTSPVSIARRPSAPRGAFGPGTAPSSAVGSGAPSLIALVFLSSTGRPSEPGDGYFRCHDPTGE